MTRYAGVGSVIRRTSAGPSSDTRSANRTSRNISPYLMTMASFKPESTARLPGSQDPSDRLRALRRPRDGCTAESTLDVCRSRLTLPVLSWVVTSSAAPSGATKQVWRPAHRYAGRSSGDGLLAPQPLEGHAHVANVPAGQTRYGDTSVPRHDNHR